jgi:nucleoside-diphosphate-sugar epimerase
MDVMVAGGHGKVGLRLLKLLAEQGHTARGIIRNPDQAGDLEAAGADAIVCDLEHDELSGETLAGVDAVVFAAGAGAGSGAERKQTMDLGGAVKLMEAAKAHGVDRYVMVSAMGAADPPEGDEGMAPYLRAKAEADRRLAESGLDYTIVRPGRLTDDPGRGSVRAFSSLERGDISRDDVAAVLLAVLETPGTIGRTFDVIDGEQPITEAIASL